MSRMREVHVSLDGASATGKTTLGRLTARHFGGAFLDTGLTFRSAALFLLAQLGDLSLVESGDWLESFEHSPARFPDGLPEVVQLAGSDITDEIWGVEIDEPLSLIARSQSARQHILRYHRALVDNSPRIVVAGRDIATTLLERADLHIVLTCPLKERIERRRAQYRAHPSRSALVKEPSDLDNQVLEHVMSRERSLLIDTSTLSVEESFARILHELSR